MAISLKVATVGGNDEVIVRTHRKTEFRQFEHDLFILAVFIVIVGNIAFLGFRLHDIVKMGGRVLACVGGYHMICSSYRLVAFVTKPNKKAPKKSLA